jgi:hypothetical protein
MESKPSLYRRIVRKIKGGHDALAEANGAMDSAVDDLERHRAKFKMVIERARHDAFARIRGTHAE